jgi:hypothetical protein
MSSNAMRFRRPEHSEIKHKNMRFLITDRPTDNNVEKYIEVSFLIQLLTRLFKAHHPII